MGPPIHRRQLLQWLGLSAVGLCAAEASGCQARAPQTVVVLGAGLAGLCAAYELRQRGFRVVVLEAQPRPGGRVLTLREGMAPQQWVEMGATRIPDCHALTLRYIDEFRLPLRRFRMEEPALYAVRGHAFAHREGTPWPSALALKPEEAALPADQMLTRYEPLQTIGDPRRRDWPGQANPADGQTLVELLRAQGMTEDGIRLMAANQGSEIYGVNALYWLMTEAVDTTWNKTFAIAGGNDQLPQAFARALGQDIHYRCVATALWNTPHGVSIAWQQDKITGVLDASFVVCALPIPTLRRFHRLPVFSAAKQEALRTLGMMPVARCAFQTSRRFWQDRGLGGLKLCRTDTAVERLWDLSHVQEGATGVLAAYLQYKNAEHFSALTPNKRLAYVVKEAAAFLPELPTYIKQGWYKIWQDDPWTQGAWAFYKPGQLHTLFPAVRRAEQRVFFCGEHTSVWSGWMQGALESAHRVVNEVLDA